jgi:hypothetical protein
MRDNGWVLWFSIVESRKNHNTKSWIINAVIHYRYEFINIFIGYEHFAI